MTGAQRYTRKRAPVNFNDRGALATEEGNQYNDAAGYADRGNEAFLDQATNFDANKSLNDYARGAFANVSAGLDQTLAKLKGGAVAAGRADSGFFDQDSGDVVRNVMSDFSNNLATHALDAAGLQQQNTAALGQFGQSQQGTATDLLTARREELENKAREEEAAKKKKRSGIGGAIGGVLGGVAGSIIPGVGTALGAGLGSAIGKMF
ncbi:MAG TPA: hypothetical protein VJ247_07780 [Gaiella sp.]|jgi:hypothetical protein|nr:hypothetical protein [Gaiella sp.]